MQSTENDVRGWFTDAVAVHVDAVYRYFVRRSSRAEADDLTSEVFAIAWRRHDDVPRDAVLPWLYRTAGFVLSNHRRKPLLHALEADARPSTSASDPLEVAALSDHLRRALGALAARDRDIVLLHAWEGLDGTELAAALGISRSGAQAALSRARARFRDLWRAEDGAVQQDEAVS
jgi:RNA polymerase sigma factor (sigma-70 family)